MNAKSARILWLGGAVVLVLAAAWWVSPALWMLLSALLLGLGGLILFAAVVTLLLGLRSPTIASFGLKLLGFLAAAVLVFWIASWINNQGFEHAVRAAKAYPTAVSPLLEVYRSGHGHYPDALDQLPNFPTPPRLMRGSYRSHGSHYSFSITGSSLLDSWDYSSQDGRWRHSS